MQPNPNPNFRAAVWRRIERPSSDSWALYLRSHGVGWSVAAALAVGVAGWTGRTAAKLKLESERQAMAEAYLVELDPRVQAKLRH